MEKKKILVVDDEDDVLKVVGKRLSDAGYDVVTASNGRDAIALAKKEQPNLIMLDIIMPDVDGGDVAGQLRENAATKDIPILFLTALVTKKDETMLHRSTGNSTLLAKPFDTEELLREIKKIL